MTPFFETGILNAATGALGLWAWWVTFVLWVFLASLTLTLQERRRWSAAPAQQPVARPEGAV